jgi:hypothetical protein
MKKPMSGIKGLTRPPKTSNPSLISQSSKQTKPITLAKVWRSDAGQDIVMKHENIKGVSDD